jgi:fumarylacetoacetase
MIAPAANTTTITKTSSKYLIWSFPQMIAHHTLNGCPLRTGDLLGSGTISGPGPKEKGSLLEMTADGAKAVQLEGNEMRVFLLNGDTVAFRATAGRPGGRVGFGPCFATVSAPKVAQV